MALGITSFLHLGSLFALGQCLCPRTNAKPQALCLQQGLKLSFSIRSTAERQTPLLQALRVSDQQCVIPERATVRADTAHAMASTETPKTATQLMQSGIFFFSKQTKDKLIRKKKSQTRPELPNLSAVCCLLEVQRVLVTFLPPGRLCSPRSGWHRVCKVLPSCSRSEQPAARTNTLTTAQRG